MHGGELVGREQEVDEIVPVVVLALPVVVDGSDAEPDAPDDVGDPDVVERLTQWVRRSRIATTLTVANTRY
jgi:hypothetical protein